MWTCFAQEIGLVRNTPAAGIFSAAAGLGPRLILGGRTGAILGAVASSAVPTTETPAILALQPAPQGVAVAIDAAWGPANLEPHLDLLAARLRVPAVRLRHNESDRLAGVMWLVIVTTDPLADTVGGGIPPIAPEDLTRILLGRNEDGTAAILPLKDRNGIVFGAESGGGKTYTINAMLAGWAQHPAVQLVVIDGKAGADYVWLEPRAQVYLPTTDRLAALEALTPYRDELNRRTAKYRAALNDWRAEGACGQAPPTSFWHTPPTADTPLLVLVIDEAQVFLTGAKTKEDKAAEAELTALIADLYNRGRSAGLITVTATQKPTTDSLPSVIRDKAAMRLVGRLSTAEAVRAALGRMPEPGEPDPQKLPQRPGMVILAPETGPLQIARSWYADPADLVRLGMATAPLRRPLPEPNPGVDPYPHLPASR
ncbi:FtsK-like protein [Gordonia polyisoprenivorans VH2]|uniref:FtsK-like protein n=1 Tax=Gordonia polyisoprenivorans (strain DSM 44266 / VH2) TaxID=1112204 RepID=H6MS03_GORPV|nr:FtsK-like protein [Gordonia polyisoprenivorans VH2]